MELMQGGFAVKLCEMEEFYGRLQSRIQLCQAKEPAALRQALEETLDEAAAHRLLLKQRTREGRLPAAAALAQAQLDYERQADQIRLRLERELCGQDAAERKAEAATLFAEYAMDFATQAAQYALSTALQALILQQPAESTDKE